MKSKIIKRITGTGAVALAGIMVFMGIQNSILTVNAADTLFGIERLIQEVQGRESSYTILEVVPDADAAEIGYYVPGYEPALSARQEGTGVWTGWQEGLGQLRTEGERTAYIEGLKQNLQEFYAARGFAGITDDEKVPVSYVEYKESDEAEEGYTELAFEDEERYGYFTLHNTEGSADEIRYEIEFECIGYTGDDRLAQEQYYIMENEDAITMDEISGIADDQLVYFKTADSAESVKYVPARWGDVKDTVSSGDAGPSASDGNSSASDNDLKNPDGGDTGSDSTGETPDNTGVPKNTGYFLLSFEMWNGEAQDIGIALFAVDTYTEKADGEYVFVETEDGFTTSFSTESIYYTGGFVNNEWFHRNVINFEPNNTENFRMKVITLTPAELNALQETGAMPEFDMLYLNSGMQAFPAKADGSAMTAYSADNDLSVAVRNELFADVISGVKPCIVDASVLYQRNGDYIETNMGLQGTQVFYLSAMFLQESPKELSEQIVGAGATADAYPTTEDLLKGMFVDEDKNFVVEQAYSFFAPDSLVNPAFGDFTLYEEGQADDISSGFGEVLDEILSENANRLADTTGEYKQLPTDVSQATVVRHIMNYANRRQIETKKEINVLEIQPCMSDEDSYDLTEAEVLSWISDGTDENQDVKITIERMTTAEFIGRIEDLNEEYDLVYIGTDKDRLNMLNNKTVFNDTSMNGLVYYHTGDIRYTTINLAGQLDTEYRNGNRANDLYYYNPVRYGGNDITLEKKNALMEFLNASYPIVVSDEFFVGGSIPLDPAAVTVYNAPNCNNANRHESFGVGCDNLDGYANIDHDINSFILKKGYRLTLYDRDDGYYYQNYCVFEATNGDLRVDDLGGYGFNNVAESLRVEFIGKSDYDINANIDRNAINEELIDNSSYIYEFVKEAKDKVNFYTRSEVAPNSGMFRFYLNRPKVSLDEKFTANGTLTDNVYHISQEEGRYKLEYNFTITNEGAASADAKYRCQLFIDINADGKYAKQEELGDITITHNGQEVKADELYTGREYKLVRTVPDGYKGLLPWKVQITQVSNSDVHNGVTGFTKLEGLPQETINILQIRKDGNDSLNLQAAIADNNNIYHKLIYGGDIDGENYEGIKADFDISVTCYSISEINDMFNNGTVDMEDYNMLILGFSDTYGNLNQTAVDAIVDFVNTGKSVLFAHDTLSFTNHEQGKRGIYDRNNRWQTREDGDAFNSYLLTNAVRSLAGMDRYGIKTVPGLASGKDITDAAILKNIQDTYKKDVAYIPGSNRTQASGLTQGYTYSLINVKNAHQDAEGKDWVNNIFYKNETGLDYDFRNQYMNIDFGQVYFNDGWYSAGEGDGGNHNNAITNLWVTKVNDGQITKYPYVLEDEFMVPTTHAQYYQLDFNADEDGDGQSDLVVWYCLGYRTDGNGNKQNTIYSMSPNDVSNNYYIYNKGNITYTGVGHSGATTNVEEAKLFINTMIASYNAGIKAPTINILSEGSAKAAEIDSIYRYYDESNKDESGENLSLNGKTQEQVFFTVNDINLINGTREISVNCYYETGEATEISVDYEETKIPVKKLDCKVYNAVTNEEVDATKLASGGIYYILFDKSVMDEYPSRFTIYFEAQSHIKSFSLEYETDMAYQKLDYTKVQLFDLD